MARKSQIEELSDDVDSCAGFFTLDQLIRLGQDWNAAASKEDFDPDLLMNVTQLPEANQGVHPSLDGYRQTGHKSTLGWREAICREALQQGALIANRNAAFPNSFTWKQRGKTNIPTLRVGISGERATRPSGRPF